MSAIWILLSLAAFAVLHSMLASHAVKARAQNWLGQRAADGVYRLFYNFMATLTIMPPLALAALLPDGPRLWRVPTRLWFITVPLQLIALSLRPERSARLPD